jgi:integrase
MPRRKQFTDAAIAALPRKPKRYSVVDPELPGFYVRVTPAGAKSFAAVTQDPSGRLVWTTIGKPELFTVDEARVRAREIIKAVRAGEGAGLETFITVAGSWLKRRVEKNGLRTRIEIERVLSRYILPAWSGRDFASITRGDVAKLLDRIEDKNGPRQADYCLAVMSAICNWYAARHASYSSPIVRGMKRTDPKRRKRARVLNPDEIRSIWYALPASDTFGDLVKISLLTGQRREKVASMRWKDIDAGAWNVPDGDREKGAGGVLKLPRLALELLEGRPRFASNPHVFAGRRRGGHFNGYSKAKRQLDERLAEAGYDLPQWQLHDLRRTARTFMADASVRPDIAERVLGHAIDGVGGVYDRSAYAEQKGQALAALATRIELILKPRQNVTPIRRRRRA